MKNKEFQKVDEYYEEIRAMVKRLKRINEEFQKEEGIKEEYYSPFHKIYELESLVRTIRNDLLDYVVRKLNKSRCPNVTVEIGPLKEKLVEKFGIGFSMKFVSGYIGKHYVAHSESKSRREILDKAKNLLPVIWLAYKRKKLTLEDMQSGKKLVLSAMSSYHYLSSSAREGLVALDKLIGITLDNVPAADVRDYDLANVFREDPYSTHFMDGNSHIEKVRAYKNGKLLIYFKTEEKAQRVAEALLK